ncbi:hypothetical protein QWJ06_08115 [Kocuria rhizophila]|uniref:hypothetical protein n=1 Tax=Kocuria rhizophila TaxID=72000 RepID=UPI001ADA1C83|nr:hypothetical protein [Kocuria rhizophila]MDN3226680.1 hypothetical protein [Kocuria rhizophila]QTK30763.1 hypothetical protein J5U48_06955 [Kocuria rhizophila]
MTVAPESTPTVTVRRCEDLLALIPHQLGHSPSDGTVLFIPVRDGHALCLSLETPDARADLPAVAEDLAGLLAGTPHCGELVVVLYCPTETGDAVTDASRALARWRSLVDLTGFELLRLLVVGPTHWWDAEEPERALPVRLIRDSPVNAQLVAEGSGAEPPLLRDDPVWRSCVQERGAHLCETLRRSADHEPRETTGRQATTPPPRLPPSPDLTVEQAGARLGAWSAAGHRVGRNRTCWVAEVFAWPDHELLRLLDDLEDDLTRDALLYMWLTGSPERAAAALAGLRAAARRLDGGAPGQPDPDTDAIEEALRCIAAVSGEWDGPPHWDAVDSAHRVLQVLDAVLDALLEAGAGDEDRWREARTTVVAVLAQLEHYRGRSLTAARLLEGICHEGNAPGPGRHAVGDVRRRLGTLPTPWWCSSRATAWPGRHHWSRG